jgi:hypothetical protein
VGAGKMARTFPENRRRVWVEICARRSYMAQQMETCHFRENPRNGHSPGPSPGRGGMFSAPGASPGDADCHPVQPRQGRHVARRGHPGSRSQATSVLPTLCRHG